MARQLGASVAVNLQAMPLTVIKTMPIDLKVIKEQQDIEKCAEMLLSTDKRFDRN